MTVLGRGSRVIAGTIQGELTREEVEKVLMDGFFPDCQPDAEPLRQKAVGLQELGLPYAADPAVTKHLAQFLHRHSEALAEKLPAKGKRKATAGPTAVLFNGGVFKAEPLRRRVAEVLNHWAKSWGGGEVKVLPGGDLDRAVARGAAYYGMVRRGKGVRIRGGAARAYYVGVETSLPAVPGRRRRSKALCVAPFGMEEGTEADVPGQEFGLVVGAPGRVPLPGIDDAPRRRGRHDGGGMGGPDRGTEPAGDDAGGADRRGQDGRRCICTARSRRSARWNCGASAATASRSGSWSSTCGRGRSDGGDRMEFEIEPC